MTCLISPDLDFAWQKERHSRVVFPLHSESCVAPIPPGPTPTAQGYTLSLPCVNPPRRREVRKAAAFSRDGAVRTCSGCGRPSSSRTNVPSRSTRHLCRRRRESTGTRAFAPDTQQRGEFRPVVVRVRSRATTASHAPARSRRNSVVEIAATIAFALTAALLLVQTLLARCRGGFRCPALARNDESLPNDLREPLRRRLAVL